MKRDIELCSVLWYYNLTREEAITVRYSIEMKDEVDGDALRKALDTTVQRYPYLMDRVVETATGYYLESNDLPVTLINSNDPIPLCGKAANYHQLALSYWKNTIIFNNTHSIFDGRGRGPFLHTLIYYYCKFRYNEEVDMPGVKLADSPVDPREYEDPYSRELKKGKFVISRFGTPEPVFRIDEAGLVSISEPQTHRIRISENAMMQLCKTNDGSPNTAIGLIMSRAITRMHPDAQYPVVCGVYCDLRSALDVPLTHHSLVTTLHLKYDKRMKDLDFSEQNTIWRGMIMLMSDPENLIVGQEAQKAGCESISRMSTLQEKTTAATTAMKGLFHSHTFLLSYSGKSNFGSCDKHISALYSEPYAKDFGMLIEVTAIDGWFDIAIAQEWKEDIYFDAFLKELTSLGLEYDILYSGQNLPAEFNPD